MKYERYITVMKTLAFLTKLCIFIKLPVFVIFQALVVISSNQFAALFRKQMMCLTGREIKEALRLGVRDHLVTTPQEMVKK